LLAAVVAQARRAMLEQAAVVVGATFYKHYQ
jgi:hypothetical protein